MPFNRLILCHPLLFLPSIFPAIRVFSNESALCIRWPKYWNFSFSISSVHSVVSNSLQSHEPQHARPPCPSPTPRVYPNSCPLSWWCHPTTSSSVIPFSSCPQSFPASGSFPMSHLFTSDDQSIGVSTSASVFLMSVQGWFPLRLTGLIPCCPKDSQESSPVPQFQGIYFSALHLLYSPSLTIIHDHWEDYSLDYTHLCWKSNISASQHTV